MKRCVNGVEHRATLDELTGRLTGLDAVGPAGVLVSTSPSYHLVGNVLRVDGPDPARAATYESDDLYRLVAAGRTAATPGRTGTTTPATSRSSPTSATTTTGREVRRRRA